jgi:hypothetical protein
LGGTQQDGSSLTQILDQRLNEERVEFGDHGAVLGVGFVLYNHREKHIIIERNIDIKERRRKERCIQHGVTLLPLYTTHSTQQIILCSTDIRISKRVRS